MGDGLVIDPSPSPLRLVVVSGGAARAVVLFLKVFVFMLVFVFVFVVAFVSLSCFLRTWSRSLRFSSTSKVTLRTAIRVGSKIRLFSDFESVVVAAAQAPITLRKK